MSFTTTSALRGSSVTLTCGTAAFLGTRFFAGTLHIALTLDKLIRLLPLHLEVEEHIMDDVSAQRTVEVLMVQMRYFACKAACHKVEERNLHLRVQSKGLLRPLFSNNLVLCGSLERE